MKPIKKLLKDLQKAFSAFFKSKKRSYTVQCNVCGKKYKGSANCFKHLVKIHGHDPLQTKFQVETSPMTNL